VRALHDDDARQAQVRVNTESSSFENPHALRTVALPLRVAEGYPAIHRR